MALQITRGIKRGAVRAVIYGVEGIGKSSLAAQIPDSLLIDTEDGTGQIDAARVVALDWRGIEHAIKELCADAQGFSAVIIDTADWLEKALIDHMLKQSGKKSIEDYGFGKGYTILQEHVVRFLSLLDQLIAKGVHVVFVAHAKVVRTSPPDQTDGYDRYELKLTKQVAPLLKEWADMVLFCNYQIQIVEGSDGKLKAQGGKERVIHCNRSAAWDAKNRYNLPEELAWGKSPAEAFAHLAHLFTGAKPRTPAKAETEATEAAIQSDPAPVVTLATPDQVKRINELRKTTTGAELIEAAMEKLNAIDLAELTSEQADELLAEIAEATKGAKTAPVLPPKVELWLNANEDAANGYLQHVKWLENAQSWRDLPPARLDSLVDRFPKFQRAVLDHAKGGKAA
jgi:hypothetical protein